MGSITVDTSRAPLLFVRFDGGVDDDAFRAYLGQLTAWLDRGERYAIVLDARTATPPPAAQRRMQADMMKSEHTRLNKLCVGGAFVIPSPLVRGALTAILWIQPLPWEHTVVADVETAEAWARNRLQRAS